MGKDAMATEMGSPHGDTKRIEQEIHRARVAKLAVQVVIVAACVFWVAYWLVSPDPASDQKYVETWVGDRSKSRFFRTDGREGKKGKAT